MGVLNVAAIRKPHNDYNFDVIGWEDFTDESEFNEIHSREEDEEEILDASQRSLTSRQRKHGERKSRVQDHDNYSKRKKGVRGKRRYDNMCYLLSLLNDTEIDDIDDEEYHMTAFADLFMDSQKMKLWNEFINLPEEKQQLYLETQTESEKISKTNAAKETGKIEKCKKAFDGIDHKIKDYLRSKNLAKGTLKEFEDHILAAIEDFPASVLVLKVASSYCRVLIHGICQYTRLKALTHKEGSECLMEIECRHEKLQCLPLSLTEYLGR